RVLPRSRTEAPPSILPPGGIREYRVGRNRHRPRPVVRCLSLIEKARPSNRYCTARALATWRARKSTVKARPAAKSSVHSSFSKAKKGRRSPESAHFNAASKACWTSRRFSSRFVIGARVPFGVVFDLTTEYLPQGRPAPQPPTRNRSNSFCFSSAGRELHPFRSAQRPLFDGVDPAKVDRVSLSEEVLAREAEGHSKR